MPVDPRRRRLSVAVVIPTIPGRDALLARAVRSVMAQRRSLEYAAGDQLLIEHDPDRTGAAATRNRALAKVTADAIAWLDDDDYLKPNHLIACLRVLRDQPDADLVYPVPVMVGGEDPTATTAQGRFPVSPWGRRFNPESEAHLRARGSFIPMTHVVRTAAVMRSGGFPEGRRLDNGRYQGEDERYLLGLLDTGSRFEHLDAKTWYWQVHRASTAGRGVLA